MNPIVKQKWLAALRSGEYKQGQKALRTGDTYCCLGVLCDLHRKECGGEWTIGPVGWCYGGNSGRLPTDVVAWAGLSDSNPTIQGREIAEHNDGREALKAKSFPEIADLIERYL